MSKMQELRILTEERNQTPHTTERRILRNPNATKEKANQNMQNAPQPQAQAPQQQTHEKKWRDQMETLKCELEELRLVQQSAMSPGMQRGLQQRNNKS